MNLNKIVCWLLVILSVTCIVLGCFLNVKSEKLKNTEAKLSEALKQIKQLNIDKNKLVIYIEQKDKAIKDIEKEYLEKLENIPKDVCGDTKPSSELLNYLKRNIK